MLPPFPARGAVLAQPPSISTIRNKLLASLPSDALARLLPKLHAVPLPLCKTLLVPRKRIEAVYFIESGWVSMVAHLDEGSQAEVGLVGFEGMIGLPVVVGVDTAFTDTYMQASGAGLQMEATAFQHELEDNPALHKLLLRYSEAMHAQSMQTAACNGRHNLEQHLARWLLMAHDRRRRVAPHPGIPVPDAVCPPPKHHPRGKGSAKSRHHLIRK